VGFLLTGLIIKKTKLSMGKKNEDMVDDEEMEGVVNLISLVVQLTAIGIQNKMEPRDVVKYFTDTLEVFLKKIEKWKVF